jgi:hypothetical protein
LPRTARIRGFSPFTDLGRRCRRPLPYRELTSVPRGYGE